MESLQRTICCSNAKWHAKLVQKHVINQWQIYNLKELTAGHHRYMLKLKDLCAGLPVFDIFEK